jgi:hypothetical protein
VFEFDSHLFLFCIISHVQEAADAKEAEGAFRNEIKEAKGNKSYDIIEV